MDKNQFFQTHLPNIEQRLEELLTGDSLLFEAARYITLSSGKKLRPILLLATVDAFHGPLDKAISPACALELLHTYSLIHDDLPCMDNDDYRRGLLTLHKKYNEATAVLTGDFLLTYSFEVLAAAPGLTSAQKIEMVRILAARAGGQGMIAGQYLDLEASQTPPSLEQLQTIHERKTADLLSAALELGGIIANVPPHQLELLRLFGKEIGLAFQIIDDVLDHTSSFEKHGKALSSDAINGKTTYVSLLGIDGAKKAAETLTQNSLNRLNAFPNPHLLKEIALSLVFR